MGRRSCFLIGWANITDLSIDVPPHLPKLRDCPDCHFAAAEHFSTLCGATDAYEFWAGEECPTHWCGPAATIETILPITR